MLSKLISLFLVNLSGILSVEYDCPTPAPTTEFLCPLQCFNSPCLLSEDPCCETGQHKVNGCNECKDGFFKKSYNHRCVHCQSTFGDECMFCQDFNGCGQCQSGCDRVYDSSCELWKCDCGGSIPDDKVRTQETNTNFGGTKFNEDDLTVDEASTTFQTGSEIHDDAILEEVFPDGSRFKTVFSSTFLQSLLNLNINVDTTGCTECSNYYSKEAPDDCDDGGTIPIIRRLLHIIGWDERNEITGGPLSVSPHKFVGLLTFSNGTHNFICSATLIGPRYILTAGHCVHEGNGGDWFNSFVFEAGKTRDYTGPSFGWSRAMTWKGWTVYGNVDWDMAVIELNSNTGLGWPSFGYDGGLQTGERFYYLGYPGDKTPRGMWTENGRLSALTTYQLRTDTTDLVGGTSGCIVYKVVTGYGPVLYAVHSSSYNISSGATVFHGHTRMMSVRFNHICDFMDEPSVC